MGARESLIQDLRRGSANFLARQHNHEAVVELLESLRSSFVSAAEGGERRASDDSGSAAAAACGTGPSAEAEGR